MRSAATSRWTLRATALLLAVLVFPTALAYVLGLGAGDYNAGSWLNKEHHASVPAFVRADVGDVQVWARGATAAPAVREAAEAGDRAALLAALAEQASGPTWWVVGRDPAGQWTELVGGADPSCADELLAAIAQRDAAASVAIVCPSGPVLVTDAPLPGAAGLRLVAGLQLDQAFADRISALTGTELILRVDGAAATASFHDGQGTPILPAELLATFPVGSTELGSGIAELPDYSGFLDAYSKERLFVGTNRQAWYLLGGPLLGSPRIELVLAIPRAIMQIAPYYTLIIMGASSALVLLVASLVLRAVIRRYTVPLDALLRSATKVARGDLSERVPTEVHPEMAHFCATYNTMLAGFEELMRVRSRLSRDAGRAELAIGMLHNVGNALNGATSGAALADEAVAQLPVRQLEQLSALFARHRDDLPGLFATGARGEHLPAFIDALARQLDGARQQIHEELERVRRAAHHASEIVRAQERHAHHVDVSEHCDVVAVIAESLGIACLPRAGVEVVREGADVHAVVDRHRVIEIVVNLLTNAADAIDALGRCGRITVALEDDDASFRVRVSDDGPGIDPDGHERIFQFGFTTKSQGHGYGLHSSCNAAVEMGGTLRLEPGRSRGACFVLTLPKQRAKLAA